MTHFLQRLRLGVLLSLLPLFGASAAGGPVDLMGYLNYNATWQDDMTPLFGFYHFSSDGSTGLVPYAETIGDNEAVTNGGVYIDGKYYCIYILGNYQKYESYFRVFDTKTWKMEKNEYLGSMLEETIACDLTYDYTTGRIYASTRPQGNTETGWLATIDKETGAFTRIAQTGYLAVLAADADGQLWGIDGRGVLYKVNKTDGTKERVGETGYAPYSMLEQSATIDFRSGRMFWFFNGCEASDTYHRTALTRLFEVDLATAKTTTLISYGNGEAICALSLRSSHPDAPDEITDLSFTPSQPLAHTGRVSFTVPGVSYRQTTLSGNVGVRLSVDGKPTGEEITAAPGSAFTKDIAVDGDGNHTLTVVLTYNGHNGTETTQTAFFGADTPKPVTDLKFTTDESRATATLTWTAPTEGVNGGYIDTQNLTYNIVRLPEQNQAATGYSGNGFTETIPDDMQYMRYKVEVCAGGKTGKAAYSNYLIAGQPHTMPFIETFSSAAGFNKFTVIDANNDIEGDDPFYWPAWHYDSEYCAAYYYTSLYGTAADDWLITPAFSFRNDKVHRLTLDVYGYHGKDNHLVVTIGNAPTAEGQTRVIADRIFRAPNLQPIQMDIEFVPAEGERYIGFHNISEAGEHMAIDNIYLREQRTGEVPAAIAQPTASLGADGLVELALALPMETATGNKLDGQVDVRIYKGIETAPVATIEGRQPGEQLTWTDPTTVPGVNSYAVTTVNSRGESIRSSVELDLSEGVPGAVTDVKAVLNDNGSVTLSWAAPAEGTDTNGRRIVPADIHYTVTRLTGITATVIADNTTALSVTDATPQADTDGTQTHVTYRITPFSATGSGTAAQSAQIIVGKAYGLPFAETWAYQVTSTGPWRSDSKTLSWSVVSTGYDPFTIGQDGPGLINADGQGNGYYLSPRINFNETTGHRLSFYLYGAPTYDDGTWLRVGYETADGNRTLLPETYYAKAENSGWREFSVDMKALDGRRSASFFFYANIATATNNTIHIDNVKLTGDMPDTEVVIDGFSGPEQLQPGVTGLYKVTAANRGSNTLTGVKASLYANGTPVSTKELSSLATGKSGEAVLEFVPTVEMASTTVALRAVVEVAGDAIDTNNEMTGEVRISGYSLPYVSAISAHSDNEYGAVISWNTPDRSAVTAQITDGAEDYAAFAIDGIGHWTMYDGDKAPHAKFNYGDSPVEWDNIDEPQAFMVFNPARTTPAIAFDAHSGDQFFTCWAADGKANDDWMISPELSGKRQMISFYARSAASSVPEPFNVLFSRGGTAPADFIKLNQNGTLSVSGGWTAFRFTMPEGARHFAINYVGSNDMGLMIDDIQYEGFDTSRRPDGYNLYRDGQRVNAEPITSLTYTDGGRTPGATHTYYLTTVYGGEESEQSAAVTVLIIDPTGICAPAAATQAVRISTRPGNIVIEGAEGNAVDIYTADGRLVSRTTGKDVSVIPAQAGLYVVRTAGATAKVMVR